FGIFAVRLVSSLGLCIDDIRLPAFKRFRANLLKFVSLRNFAHELSRLFPFLFLFRQTLSAILLAFILALVDDLLNLLIFLLGVLSGEWLIIFRDLARHRILVENHDLVGFRID